MEEVELGAKVREFRTLRGMTVRTLAQAAGITPSMLSQIERDLVNPSIPTLKILAQALGVPLWQFFRAGESKELVVRHDRRKTIGLPDDRSVRYELLTADTSGTIEFCEMVIPANASSGVAPQSHSGEETAYVLDGPVAVTVGGGEYALDRADSIRIPPFTEHRWTNHGPGEARVLFAVTPPGF